MTAITAAEGPAPQQFSRFAPSVEMNETACRFTQQPPGQRRAPPPVAIIVNQIGRQRRQSIVLTFRRAYSIAAFASLDEAGFARARAERSQNPTREWRGSVNGCRET
jgi:hypothetical protein